jgi:hypothetical protein
VSRAKCSNCPACAGEDADGHVGEHCDCCIWAVRYAQPLLQTRGCGEIEWARGSARGDGKGDVESGCTVKDFNLDSNTMTLIMVCGGTAIHQETKFHGGDSFETTMTNTVGARDESRRGSNKDDAWRGGDDSRVGRSGEFCDVRLTVRKGDAAFMIRLNLPTRLSRAMPARRRKRSTTIC